MEEVGLNTVRLELSKNRRETFYQNWTQPIELKAVGVAMSPLLLLGYSIRPRVTISARGPLESTNQ